MVLEKLAKSMWSLAYAVQGVVLTFLMLSVTVIVFIQVILRYVLHAPLMGIEELVLFPAIWHYMLGGANASLERNHIQCNVITVYIKNPVALSLLNLLKSIISLSVCLWLAYWAYKYFMYSLKVWKLSNLLYIPLFFGESSLFICLVLMSIYTSVELCDHLIKVRSLLRERG